MSKKSQKRVYFRLAGADAGDRKPHKERGTAGIRRTLDQIKADIAIGRPVRALDEGSLKCSSSE